MIRPETSPSPSPPRHGVRAIWRSRTAGVGFILTSLVSLVALFDRRIAPGNPFTTSPSARLTHPSRAHLMGTDQLGRDVFTGVVQGAHTSFRIVIGVVFISGVIGLLVGTVAGLRGGILDDVVQRLVEIVQTVPRFFLSVLAIAWFGPGGRTLTILLGLTSWPLIARVLRAEALSLREQGFVGAARSMGASDLRILLHHIIPNVLPTTFVFLALTGSRVVLLEAGLAFLGLGDPNVASWGSLINNAQPYLEVAWWMWVFPGGAIVTAVLGMNLLADGLTGALAHE